MFEIQLLRNAVQEQLKLIYILRNQVQEQLMLINKNFDEITGHFLDFNNRIEKIEEQFKYLEERVARLENNTMSEPFNTSITLTKDDARRFHEYDSDPLKYENDRSKAAARRARKLAEKLKWMDFDFIEQEPMD